MQMPFAAVPGVPTVASQIRNFVTGFWQGLLTPPAVLEKLRWEAVLRTPAPQQKKAAAATTARRKRGGS